MLTSFKRFICCGTSNKVVDHKPEPQVIQVQPQVYLTPYIIERSTSVSRNYLRDEEEAGERRVLEYLRDGENPKRSSVALKRYPAMRNVNE